MKRPLHIPFQNLTATAWKRLALAGVFLLYLINFLFITFETGTLNGLGNDFLAFWSAGKVADQYGYAEINNLDTLGEVEFQQLERSDIPQESFQPIAAAYFSIFLVPFQLLSKVNARASFWFWTIVNLFVLVGYGLFFIRWVSKNLGLNALPSIVLLSLLLSYPVYTNIIYGQLNVILLICSGEFIRNALAKKPLASGLWLGGLLLKLPLLLLIIPALLFMKNWRVFAGFVLSAVGLVLASTALSGFAGMLSMIKLWFAFIPGFIANSPNAMANWRMLAVNINKWSSSWVGWIPAGIGMLVTLTICFFLCRKPFVFGTPAWVENMMAIFAVSCAFSWHSHAHMGMVMIPFLLFLAARRLPPVKIIEIDAWAFAIPAALLLGYVLSIVLLLSHAPAIENLSNFLTGLTGLAVYMLIAIKGLKRKDSVDLRA